MHVFYVTLYQTKHNQKDESFTYQKVCLALSKRIKTQKDLLEKSGTTTDHSDDTGKGGDDQDDDPDNEPGDFGEGLKRMLSSLYGHTSSNVLSATMAKKLLSHGSRFQFSHEFMNISLVHLLQWINDEEDLEYRLRKVKKTDVNGYECVMDLFINNIIYRPVELEDLSCYELVSLF